MAKQLYIMEWSEDPDYDRVNCVSWSEARIQITRVNRASWSVVRIQIPEEST